MGFELAKAFISVRAESGRLNGDFSVMRRMTSAHIQGMNTLLMRGIGLFGAFRVAMAAASGVQLATDIEQTRIAFETMIGSTQKANKLIGDMFEFAKRTPFRFEGVKDAAQTLLAVGIPLDDILPLMEDLGDVSAGTGKNFRELAIVFGQVRSKGRLMAQEILQFTEANIPIMDVLSRTLGRTEREILKMTEQGKISFAQVEEALRSLSREGGRFNNLMARQSQTVGGLWSTLQDEVSFTLLTIFEALAPMTKEFIRFGLDATQAIHKAVLGMSGSINRFAINTVDWVRVIYTEWGTAWELITVSTAIQLVNMRDAAATAFASIANEGMGAWQSLLAGMKEILSFAKDMFKTLGLGFAYFGANIKDVLTMQVGNSDITEGIGLQLDKMIAKTTRDLTKSTADAMAKAGAEGRRTFVPNLLGTEELRKDLDRLSTKLGTAKAKLEEARAAEPKGFEENRPPNPFAGGGNNASPLLKAGRFDYKDFGRKIQDALLKGEDDGQQQMIDLLQKNNKLQEEQLREQRKPVQVEIKEAGLG